MKTKDGKGMPVGGRLAGSRHGLRIEMAAGRRVSIEFRVR